MGGGVISPEVTPTVIEQLTEALERERRRTRQLEVAQQALLERAARRHELISRLGHELRTPVTVILGMAQTLTKGTAPRGRARPDPGDPGRSRRRPRPAGRSGSRPPSRPASPSGPTSRRSPARSPSAYPRVRRGGAARPCDGQPEPHRRRPHPGGAGGQRPGVLARPVPRWSSACRSTTAPPRSASSTRATASGPRSCSRIFDPLEQGQELNTRTHPGVGLGLTLARMSARAMDGDVTLESTGPEGSTFLWTVSQARARISLLEAAHVHVQQDPHRGEVRQHLRPPVADER